MSIMKELSKVEAGKTFKIGDYEFINFPEAGGTSVAVSKDTVFNSKFGESNNFKTSAILERLNKEILLEIEEVIGAENICDVTTDLTTLDGLKTYGEMVSKISLPTLAFYRERVAVFDEYKLDKWWWLATPDSAEPHYKDCPWALCVSPGGDLGDSNGNGHDGVRPFLRFQSSIFVSCEE